MGYSTQQYSTVQSCIVHYSTLQYSTLQHSIVHYSTLQYSTLHKSTLQYSTVQYTTVQSSIVHYSTLQYSSYKEDKDGGMGGKKEAVLPKLCQNFFFSLMVLWQSLFFSPTSAAW